MSTIPMIHGTSSSFLPSIKQFGLVPDSKNKIWNDYSKATYENPSCKSLFGTYFTNNILTAYSAAKTAITKYPGNILLVSAQIDTSTALADEDNIWCWIETWLEKTLAKHGFKEHEADKFLGFFESQREQYITNTIKWFSEKLHRELTEECHVSIDYNLLRDVFYASLIRRCSHLYKEDKVKFSINYQSQHKLFKLPSKQPPIECSEEEYIQTVERMSVVYTASCVKETNLHTLRIPSTVSFYGINHIKGMMVINEYSIIDTIGDVSFIKDKLSHHKNLALCGI